MKIHWFHFVSTGVLALFMGMLVYVTFVAYARTSGSTGQDMARIQQSRYQETQKHQIAFENDSSSGQRPEL